MKFPLGIALLAATALAGCSGPQGNPNGQPYANEAGGVLAVQPQTIGTATYDPYVTPASFSDMQAGQPAINPPPPLPLTPAAPPPPARKPY